LFASGETSYLAQRRLSARQPWSIAMKTKSALAFYATGIALWLGFQTMPARAQTPAKHPAEAALTTRSPFDGKTLDGWIQVPENTWTVKDGAMASLGAGRGVICTQDDYSKYRLLFTMRHVSGEKDHRACVLIFCTRPGTGEKPLDALGGIQFQPPNGGHWDYRKGHNNAAKELFTRVLNPKFDEHQWFRVELLVDAAAGTGRMAVAQPVGATAVEVLQFKDPAAGQKGPIAWQMHNATLFDEYKDVEIEVEPQVTELITTR
jgi:3-keto-disaccharide hydrolase